ncbi:hypothetical protein B5F25_17255 [Bacteroides sp. An19]|jgi:hypothetical protein|nr:hypothetical protein B5F25_17255 [Bacteroides sp. An19]
MFLSIAINIEGLTSFPVFGFLTSLHRGYFSAPSMGKGQPANPVVEIRFQCSGKEDFHQPPVAACRICKDWTRPVSFAGK